MRLPFALATAVYVLCWVAEVGAFSTTFSSPSQCERLVVNWSGSPAAPPFQLLLVPFSSKPITIDIPESAWNSSTFQGLFEVENLPLPSGTQFLAIMDDGLGRGSGGVSQVMTVSSSSNSTCISSSVPETQVVFAPIGNPAQCMPHTVQWNGTVASNATSIRGFVPGGSAFGLDITGQNSTVWDVNVAAGTQIVLMLDSGERGQMTSPLMTVGSSDRNNCLIAISPSVTVSPANASVTSAAIQSTLAPSISVTDLPLTTPKSKPPPAVIIGAVIGSVVALSSVMSIAYFIWNRRRRRPNPDDFEPIYHQSLAPAHTIGLEKHSRSSSAAQAGWQSKFTLSLPTFPQSAHIGKPKLTSSARPAKSNPRQGFDDDEELWG